MPVRSYSSARALTSPAELLEFEPASIRQELFREVARASQTESGRRAVGPVLFPIIVGDGEVRAAAGLDLRADLLQAPDAGEPLQLVFESRENWSDVRRDSLQGLSEREAAELVSRSLLSHWGVQPAGAVRVERASGMPYAAALVEGVLRLNPAFVYLAASSNGPSSPAPTQ